MRKGPVQAPTLLTVYRDHRIARPQSPYFSDGDSPNDDMKYNTTLEQMQYSGTLAKMEYSH